VLFFLCVIVMDGLAAFTIFLIFFIIIWFLAMNGCVNEKRYGVLEVQGNVNPRHNSGYMLM
jgi:hypothetical protein